MNNYNIFARLQDDLQDFQTGFVNLAHGNNEGLLRYLPNQSGGYRYSQRHVLNLIDLYYNSKFESGQYDSEGQRKVFLNIGKFRADVAAMQTDIDVKDYVFIPDTEDDIWKTWLMSRKFKMWARENYYGMLLNELNKDYSKYGTCVLKAVGKKLNRVPIRSLINTQSAKSLQEAVDTGGHVTEVHYYSLGEMEAFPNWNLQGLEFDGKTAVYERYSKVPRAYLNMVNGKSYSDADWKDWVKTVSILVPSKEVKGHQEKNYKGTIVFMEEVDEIPYQECHWDKQDGRWLGKGEIENQFENQIARNFTANLRKRSLLWASKKIFQSTDEAVRQNLVKEVKDGQVITIAPNGNISQIATESRNLAEFQADEASWDKNSDQISFSYEVATGEALPSGTPLGLGVLLTGATKKHFKLKQQDFGLFLEKSFFKLLIPIFQKNTKDHTLAFLASEKGIENFKQAMVEIKTNEAVLEKVLAGEMVDLQKIKADVADKATKSSHYFVDVPKSFYTDAQFHMELDISGEERDISADIQSYQFLFNSYMALQDTTRANAVLDAAAALKGINTSSFGKPVGVPQPGQTAPQGTGLAPQGDVPAGVSEEVKALAQ